MAEDTSRGRLLVVDDKLENLDILLDYLKLEGFEVLLAHNGLDAIQLAQDQQPDVILLDVMMPGIDGFETCQRLKAQDVTKHIPVIFMTALSGTKNTIKGFDVGGVDYVVKPFQSQELLARVQTHVTLRRLQKTLEEKNQRLEEYVHSLAEKSQQLDEKNNQLEDVNATKDRFVSIVSQDLKDQLGELKGFSELIHEHLDDYSREDLKKLLADINKPIEQLYGIFENLLTWSRIQRGKIEYHPEPMHVRNIISRNLSVLTSKVNRKHISVETSLPEDVKVCADSEMVDTIVYNLLSNAIKFSHVNGNIRISAEQRDNMVEMSISDSGIGIAAEHLPNLFRIDAQFKNPGTLGEKGTGLGLIICKALIERNGGRISVTSHSGKGTTFAFTLPQQHERV